MLLRTFCFITAMLALPLMAQETDAASTSEGEQAYVSDELFAFMHAGPSRNYRILGSIVAGTPITLIRYSDDREFVEVIDDRQRTGWIEAINVMRDTSLRVKLPQIQQQLSDAQAALQDARQNAESLQQQIADLESRLNGKNRQFEQLQAQVEQAEQQLSSKDQSELHEWFMRGGMIALAGIIIGVIIPYLPKKKRNRDGWMD